jgi:UDP-2-acetamido-3-amino-2,3-dideoxy-glucuronate N-acetyltransferase
VKGDSLPGRVSLVRLSTVHQSRGSLHVAELGGALPFVVERFFLVDDVPGGTRRGQHANVGCHQLLVAVRGSITVELGPDAAAPSILLDDPAIGLHIPPLVWASQVYGPGAVLLVATSSTFEHEGHIEDPTDSRLRWD